MCGVPGPGTVINDADARARCATFDTQAETAFHGSDASSRRLVKPASRGGKPAAAFTSAGPFWVRLLLAVVPSSFAARIRPRTMSKRANSIPENGHGQEDVDLWPNWYGWSWSAAPVPSLLPSVDGVRSCSAIRRLVFRREDE